MASRWWRPRPGSWCGGGPARGAGRAGRGAGGGGHPPQDHARRAGGSAMTAIDYTDCAARAAELLARAETPGADDAVRDCWVARAGAYSRLAQAEALGRIADAAESLL